MYSPSMLDVNTEMQKVTKKKGRPPGKAQEHQLQMRVSAEFLRDLDALRKAEDDLPSRTEMIRRLVERGKR
jgi:hypothetical protein